MIPITRPTLDELEQRAVAEVLATGWVAQGPQVERFERLVAEYVGAADAVAVSSGTTALHLALVAAGIGPGDEVIIPSLSFIATANAVLHAGARPVLVDVEPRSYTMDPAAVAAAITPRTRALMPVHQVGLAADMDALLALARDQQLVVIEDGACALGATYRGRRVGALHRVCCFSFHPRKIITTGEGGMITTGDPDLAARLRCLRNQGMESDAFSREGQGGAGVAPIRKLGFNYRLTDIQAAIGAVQMGRLPGLLERRRAVATRYDQLLSGTDKVVVPHDPWRDVQSGVASHSYQSYMVVLAEGCSRDAVVQDLQRRGITSRPGVTAIHEQPLYRRGDRSLRLPETERLSRQGLILPLFPTLTEAEQERVAQALKEALGT